MTIVILKIATIDESIPIVDLSKAAFLVVVVLSSVLNICLTFFEVSLSVT